MKNQTIFIAVLTLLLGIGVSFFSGTKYQQSKTPLRGQFTNMPGQGQGTNRQTGGQGEMRAGIQNGFRPVAGEITSIDSQSLTVKLPDSSSKIIILTDQTAINKTTQAGKTDLKVGDTVSVFGQTNTDGSVTAQNIQLAPPQRVTPTP